MIHLFSFKIKYTRLYFYILKSFTWKIFFSVIQILSWVDIIYNCSGVSAYLRTLSLFVFDYALVILFFLRIFFSPITLYHCAIFILKNSSVLCIIYSLFAFLALTVEICCFFKFNYFGYFSPNISLLLNYRPPGVIHASISFIINTGFLI